MFTKKGCFYISKPRFMKCHAALDASLAVGSNANNLLASVFVQFRISRLRHDVRHPLQHHHHNNFRFHNRSGDEKHG